MGTVEPQGEPPARRNKVCGAGEVGIGCHPAIPRLRFITSHPWDLGER